MVRAYVAYRALRVTNEAHSQDQERHSWQHLRARADWSTRRQSVTSMAPCVY
jgi:hypothetical protein